MSENVKTLKKGTILSEFMHVRHVETLKRYDFIGVLHVRHVESSDAHDFIGVLHVRHVETLKKGTILSDFCMSDMLKRSKKVRFYRSFACPTC
jgi:hypothetical protein